jgi:HEAT repeat protein
MRYKAMDVIGHMNHLGTNAHIAVPIFVNCTKEKDLRAVANAARALGCLAIEPETSVPALAAVLTNSDTEARIMAAMTLSQFNARARSAAPALLKATEDKDDRAKLAATSALRIIAPEAFTNPPSQ